MVRLSLSASLDYGITDGRMDALGSYLLNHDVDTIRFSVGKLNLCGEIQSPSLLTQMPIPVCLTFDAIEMKRRRMRRKEGRFACSAKLALGYVELPRGR